MATSPDEPAALELARRLLSHPVVDITVELTVGAVPAAFTDLPPLPTGARLLGSVLNSRQGRALHLEAVLDAGGEPAEVAAAYAKELAERGWSVFEGFPRPPHGGFAPGPPFDGGMFRQGEQGPVLVVSAVSLGTERTDLRVRLDWEMPRHVGDWGGGAMRMAGAGRMPQLHAPRGVALEMQGSSGGEGRWTSEARIDADLSVAELEEHFASQLAAAGWERVAGRADDVVGWSSWLVPGDGNWRGLLTVLAPFAARERSLSLRIESRDRDTGGRGPNVSSIFSRGS